MGHFGRISPKPPVNQGGSRQSAHQLPISCPALALICPVLTLGVVLMTHYVNTNDNHYTLCYHCQPHLSSHQFSLYAQFDKLPKVSEQCVMYNYPPFPLLFPSFFLHLLLPCAYPSLSSFCVVAACVLVLYDPTLLLILCLSFFYSLYILYYSFFIYYFLLFIS